MFRLSAERRFPICGPKFWLSLTNTIASPCGLEQKSKTQIPRGSLNYSVTGSCKTNDGVGKSHDFEVDVHDKRLCAPMFSYTYELLQT
jgi:hypothetical protein